MHEKGPALDLPVMQIPRLPTASARAGTPYCTVCTSSWPPDGPATVLLG